MVFWTSINFHGVNEGFLCVSLFFIRLLTILCCKMVSVLVNLLRLCSVGEVKENNTPTMSVHPNSTKSDQPVQPPPVYEPPTQQIHPPVAPPPVMQQQSTTNVVVVNNQPVAENRLILGSVYGHRDWTTGLFGCFEDSSGCLQTMFCWECTIMEISAKLNENVCVVNCVPGSMVTLRTRLRTLGGIQGSICKDYCALWCFPMCAICQMKRELRAMQL